jgi:hypothetical protein
MPRTFVIWSGTNIHPRCETARSATEALELVREHIRLRRLNLIVETADGEQLSFFQLKDLAHSEMHAEAPTPAAPEHPRSL